MISEIGTSPLFSIKLHTHRDQVTSVILYRGISVGADFLFLLHYYTVLRVECEIEGVYVCRQLDIDTDTS